MKLIQTTISDKKYTFIPPPPNNISFPIHSPEFLKILYSRFSFEKPLNILDLGCGNGGLICDIINDGHNGVGIDKTKEYLTIIKEFGWKSNPDNFFIGDITQPYHFVNKDNIRILFDVILSCETLEHLTINEIPNTLNEIYKNLKPDGITIHQISHLKMEGHYTIQPRDWWTEQFKMAGFTEIDLKFDDNFIRTDCKEHSYLMSYI